jgi:hypothetical protein
VLAVAGSLGVDGKGKAPHWRLTELGNSGRASADGMFDPPSRDYLHWDGVLFDPKPFRYSRKWDYEKQNPGVAVNTTPVTTSITPPVSASTTPKSESVVGGVAIDGDASGVGGEAISSLTTTVVSLAPTPAAQPTSSEGPPEEENHVGLSEEKNNVVNFDERIAASEATEKKKRMLP